MGSLSQRELAILFEMELSLLTDPHSTGHHVVREIYVTERRRVKWCTVTALFGFLLLASALTESLSIALVGVAIMIASVLTIARRAPIMRRASAMLRHPSIYE